MIGVGVGVSRVPKRQDMRQRGTRNGNSQLVVQLERAGRGTMRGTVSTFTGNPGKCTDCALIMIMISWAHSVL